MLDAQAHAWAFFLVRDNEFLNERVPVALCSASRTSFSGAFGSSLATIDPGHISTSYVERQNLTMRMHMRRFTRLTNGFSKKVENHNHSISLHFAYYNFVKIHQTLKITPAMAASVTNRLWEIEDLLALLD